MEDLNFADPFGSQHYVESWLAESSDRAKRALMRDTYRAISEALIKICRLPDHSGKVDRAIGAIATCQRLLISEKSGVIDRRLSCDIREAESATIYVKIRMQSIAIMMIDPRIDHVTDDGLQKALCVLKSYGHLVGADEQRLDRYAGLLDRAVSENVARRRRFRQ